MRRLRQDLDWIVSAGLLLAVVATAATGLIADLWDLNDFWYHTVSGYVMGGFAVAHILYSTGSAWLATPGSGCAGGGAACGPSTRRPAAAHPAWRIRRQLPRQRSC